MVKNIRKNISKNLSGKYGKKILNHAKQSAADALKTNSKRVIQRAAEWTGDLIGNQISTRVTKVSTDSQQSNSETVINYYDKEITKEWFISSEERQEIIDELRLI